MPSERPKRWAAVHVTGFVGLFATRPAAMNALDRAKGLLRHRRWRWACVKHEGTGERWERLKGSWFKLQEARGKR